MNELKELVVRSKQGDVHAFAKLYEHYSNQMYRFAFYYLGAKEDAQDAVQDAVCEAFKAINSLKNDDSFKPWLFKILSNCCKKQITKCITGREVITEIKEEETFLNESEMSDALLLKSEILSLDEQEREIILLCVVCGYNSKEVSKIIGIPAGTVRSKLSRTLIKLRKSLEEDRYEKTR